MTSPIPNPQSFSAEASKDRSAILVVGTIAIDNVKTPQASEVNLLGGSASYAALAASYSGCPVHLVGIIGHDFPSQHLAMLQAHGISLDGIERSEGASFSWSGEYHENMNDRTTHQVAINVLENWQVKIPEPLRSAPLVVLANMSPENQMQVIEQCEAALSSNPRSSFFIADTMDLWIHIANERLHDVLKRVDLFVINEGEAREFTGTSNLILAGQRLLEKGPRHVVIKLGEFGAMLFSSPSNGSWTLSEDSFFRCAAFPLTEVADPTGAGDSFLGALAGHLATTGKSTFDFQDIRAAIVQGAVVASFTCEAFSTRRIEGLETAEIGNRLEIFKKLTHW
jgi:sugar/nucleoside kinase (ribokinase family)